MSQKKSKSQWLTIFDNAFVAMTKFDWVEGGKRAYLRITRLAKNLSETLQKGIVTGLFIHRIFPTLKTAFAFLAPYQSNINAATTLLRPGFALGLGTIAHIFKLLSGKNRNKGRYLSLAMIGGFLTLGALTSLEAIPAASLSYGIMMLVVGVYRSGALINRYLKTKKLKLLATAKQKGNTIDETKLLTLKLKTYFNNTQNKKFENYQLDDNKAEDLDAFINYTKHKMIRRITKTTLMFYLMTTAALTIIMPWVGLATITLGVIALGIIELGYKNHYCDQFENYLKANATKIQKSNSEADEDNPLFAENNPYAYQSSPHNPLGTSSTATSLDETAPRTEDAPPVDQHLNDREVVIPVTAEIDS